MARGGIDPRRAKTHRSYSVAEAARLFVVHRNTVRHWIKAGLPVVRAGRELLILGRDLGPFLAERQRLRRRKCAPDQLYCFRCQQPRRPREGTAHVVPMSGPTPNVSALCEVCGTRMFQRTGHAKRAALGVCDGPRNAGAPEPSR